MDRLKLGDKEYKVTPGGLLKLGALLAFIAGVIWLFRWSPWAGNLTPDNIKAWLTGMGGWGYFVFIGIFALGVAACLPVNTMIIIAASLYGFWLCAGLTYAASLAGALIAYGVGRWAGKDLMRAIFKDKLDDFVVKMNEGRYEVRIPLTQKRFALTLTRALLVLRTIPLLPGWMVNYGCGLGQVGFRKYFWTAVIGLVPQALAYALMFAVFGDVLLSWFTPGELIIVDFLFPGVFIIAIGVIVWLVRRKRKKDDGKE